jgi:two-component system sensor histidine kinase YesM
MKLLNAEIARKNMNLSLLASQMDAHFVVNTLKSVKYLTDNNEAEKAGQMAEGLAAILKHRHAGEALVNIFEDLQMLEKYIEIVNLKFDGKLAVFYHVEDKLEAYLMPGLILQPIVENALMHGLVNKEDDPQLTIKGFSCDECILFEISDNGIGIPSAKLNEIAESLRRIESSDFPAPGLHGVALTNIQRRIRISCGEQYGIAVASRNGEGTTVTVTLPMVSDR